MFESAELGHRIDKERFKAEEPKLRKGLLDAQYAMKKARAFPLIILIGGVDGAGKGETVNLLNEWMDPRHIQVHAMGEPTDEERLRPPVWRYWRSLPPKGKTGIFFRSWYTTPIRSRVARLTGGEAFQQQLSEITRFEQMLGDEGALILKFWMHLSKKGQRKRLKELEANPLTRWRVTADDWKGLRLYDRYRAVSEEALRLTSTGTAPWLVVEGTDHRYRSLTVGQAILGAIRRRLDEIPHAPSKHTKKGEKSDDAPLSVHASAEAAPPSTRTPDEAAPPSARGSDDAPLSVRSPAAGPPSTTPPADATHEEHARTGAEGAPKHHVHHGPLPAPLVPSIDQVNLLATLDLTQKVEKKQYRKTLESLQGKLNRLTRHPHFSRHAVVCVFEGSDAAGKGGAIRRVTAALDARYYAVIPIASPTEEERAQPYLWRFWRHIPSAGRLALFDRSWYGRVLVERVEGFAPEASWMRAYGEINDFEEQLTRAGVIVAKFWLQISKEEQLRRFEERERIAFKRFKITAEDWRNREKWDEYTLASSDMVDRTSTDHSPWCLVEAEDKHHARIKILKTLTSRIEEVL